MILSCQAISQQHIGFSFILMVTYMQLAVMCQSLIMNSNNDASQEKSNVLRLYIKYVANLKNAPVERSFYRWYSTGCRYISLVAGGSFYILVLIAGLELHKTISEVGGNIFSEVGQMLRQPETMTPKLIRDSVIPTIAWIRSQMPMSLQNLFCPSFTEHIGVGETLDCTNISLTDKVFGAFKQNTYSLPARDLAAWSSCTSTIAMPCRVMCQEGHIGGILGPALRNMECFLPPMPWQPNISVLKTSFKGDPSDNQGFPAKTNRRENIAWTEGERARAEAGYVVRDFEDLCNKLDNLYIDGRRKSELEGDAYVRIPMEVLQGGELELRNSDDSLLLFACSSLPDQICCNLTSSLLARFDGKEADPPIASSSEQVAENILLCPFQSLHFSLWNRYITSGGDAPPRIHPYDMVRTDVSHTNYSQHLPYPSRDILQHQQLYRNIQSSFEELFQWIEQVIKKCLPTEFEVLAQLAQDLPGGDVSPVFPFLSLVVNLNVSTLAH
ncbi:hypothetical protein F4604DRAFT_1532350, partial [Suillus subluteus]